MGAALGLMQQVEGSPVELRGKVGFSCCCSHDMKRYTHEYSLLYLLPFDTTRDQVAMVLLLLLLYTACLSCVASYNFVS